MAVIIAITASKQNAALKVAAAAILAEKLVVIPTESSYGVAALASSRKAVAKVFSAKARHRGKAVSVLFGSVAQAEKYCKLGKPGKRLVREFMPGRLTLVAPRKGKRLEFLGGKGLAFRIPSNEFARALAKKVGQPITATSANISGSKALYSGKKAIKDLGDRVDVIVDAGTLHKRRASTIFDLETKKVLRKGPVSESAIKKVLREKR